MKKITTTIALLLILSFVLVSLPEIGIVKAESTIYIRADGSIEGTEKIQRDGDVYTFTDKIVNQSITVDRNDIIIDGSGLTLEGTGNGTGVYLPRGRENITIKNLKIKEFYYAIDIYFDATNNKISGNMITDNYSAIRIRRSSNNTIVGNEITNNYYSISLSMDCDYHIIVDNNITNNGNGIIINNSRNTTIRNNTMIDNTSNNLLIEASTVEVPYFTHDIDTSNTVNGKTIYYWINQQNKVVPSDAGYVYLVNCTNMTIQNLNLTKGGIRLILTNNSMIINNRITNCDGIICLYVHNTSIIGNLLEDLSVGIYTHNGLFNEIMGNRITNTSTGIRLHCPNSTIFGNVISNNTIGLRLYGPDWNRIIENNFISNEFAVSICDVYHNIFYHNNFINNTNQIVDDFFTTSNPFYPFLSTNTWDDGYPSGGNFWSDYNGTDNDGDGFGDTPYFLYEENQDNYPLMTPVDITIIPEFPSWTVMLVILTLLAVAVAIYKRRLRPQTN